MKQNYTYNQTYRVVDPDPHESTLIWVAGTGSRRAKITNKKIISWALFRKSWTRWAWNWWQQWQWGSPAPQSAKRFHLFIHGYESRRCCCCFLSSFFLSSLSLKASFNLIMSILSFFFSFNRKFIQNLFSFFISELLNPEFGQIRYYYC